MENQYQSTGQISIVEVPGQRFFQGRLLQIDGLQEKESYLSMLSRHAKESVY